MEAKTRKWRWGVNRWFVLALIILSIIGVNLAAPVRPHIQVAAENLTTQPLFGDFYLTNTMTTTVLVDLILIGLALAVRGAVKRAERTGDLVPRGISGAMEMLVEMLYNLAETTAGKWTRRIFPWFATIFLMVLLSNLVKLIPGVESIGIMHHAHEGVEGYAIAPLGGNWYQWTPTPATGEEAYVLTPFFRSASTDLNYTLALALIAVGMTQVFGMRAQGIRYFSKFLNFTTMFKKPLLGFMDFLVGLLELISEFAKILSFAFRLFGNMFAGMVLLALVGVMVPIFVPSMLYMFELFIGVIQAFVFGMLAMVFMAQATQGHGGEEHGQGEAH